MDVFGSYLVGALGGLTVVVGERLLFRARTTWQEARRSKRFYGILKERLWGEEEPWYCPSCLNRDLTPNWERTFASEKLINGVRYRIHLIDLRCPECGENWPEELGREQIS